MRTIEAIISPGPTHFVGDGFRVHHFIPGQVSRERMDPFIMMDYNSRFHFPPSERARGVGVHPHRGFETVTLAYEGAVAHHDSGGNSGVIREGDVQWMTAGDGILHKEYHEEVFSRTGGYFQMVQLWVNLPAKDKKTAPKYQGLTHAEINRFYLPEGSGEIEVIAGRYQEIAGSASTFTPVHLLNARLKKNAAAGFSFPEHFNTALLVVKGNMIVNGAETVATDHFVLFGNDHTDFEISATEDAVVLILSGEPINEPLVQYGPFVMNSQEEIYQSIRNFNLGKYGYLED